MSADPNDNAPKYEETDVPGVYITTEVPTSIPDTPSSEDGIWYDEMTPEQKSDYGIFPVNW